MKNAFCSTYIKKSKLSDEANRKLSEDLVAFNKMKHSAFSWNNQNKVFDDKRSIHVHLKDKYECNDYFANSANREAKSIISSQNKLKESYETDIEDDITAIKKAIAKKVKRLKSLTDVHKSIIDYTKMGYKNPYKLKTCQNVHFEEDGRVRVQFFKNKQYFDNLYLFEHQWLVPQINRLKQNIKAMKHKLVTLEQHLACMKTDKRVHVCFGTKKLYHDERLHGEQRRRALQKRRNARMQISGRCDSRNGNWVFTYDLNTGDLSYKSMLHWDEDPIVFPCVIFPYGQEQIENYLANHNGAVAWEIVDCGNAWQIVCTVDTASDERKNDCFDTGCVAYDVNYDNISFTELDACGNLKYHRIIRFNPEGLTSGQLEQVLSHALEKVFKHAKLVKKPVVCEKIENVQRKKFYDKNTKRTRHISMFASNKINLLALSKSEKYGIALININPAYTSKTGLLKYKKRYGLSTHEAASFVIGRRGMGFVDKVPKEWKVIASVNTGKTRLNQWKSVTSYTSKLKWHELNALVFPKKPVEIKELTGFE